MHSAKSQLPVTKVELSVACRYSYAPQIAPGGWSIIGLFTIVFYACRNLRNKDVLSKSDPMCILFMEGFGNENYMEVCEELYLYTVSSKSAKSSHCSSVLQLGKSGLNKIFLIPTFCNEFISDDNSK